MRLVWFTIIVVLMSYSALGISCSGTARPALPTTFDGYVFDCGGSIQPEGVTVTASHLDRNFTSTVDGNGQYGITNGPLSVERCTDEQNSDINFTLNGFATNESSTYNAGGDFPGFNLSSCIDFSPATIIASSFTLSSFDAIVSLTLNETGNLTINFGETEFLGNISTNETAGTEISLSFSGLSHGTNYLLNITTCDTAPTPNCVVNNSFSFSTFSVFAEEEPTVIVTFSTALFNVTTNASTNLTLAYNTTDGDFDTFSTNTTFGSDHSLLLSSLSASTIYFYNLTFCDAIGFCVVNGSYNFTTDSSSSSSSSSSGGGGGGGSSSGGGGGGSSGSSSTSSGLPAPSSSSSSSSTSTSSGGGSIEPVPPQDIVNTLPSSWDSITVTPVGSSQSSNSATIDQIQSAVSDANGVSTLQTIGESLSRGVASVSKATTKLEVFEIINNETKEEVYRTKVTVVVEPQEYDQKDVRVLEVIPKSAAMSVKELSFIHPPTILQDDPVVLWNIPSLKAAETQSFVYFILKRVDSLSDQTLVTGTRVSTETTPDQEPLRSGKFSTIVWIVIGIIGVVLFFGVIILFLLRKKSP